MFTDLVDSTAYKERVGEEASLRVLLDYYALLGRAISPHNGRLWKFLGDGMLASFPSTRDAVHAAVRIQQAVTAYNRRRTRLERMPEVRVGIDNGDVNVVNLGGERQDLVGRIVDRCSRICAMAEGGHILATDEGSSLPGWLRSDIDAGRLKVAQHNSTQWKGGGQQRVKVKEILFRPVPGKTLLARQEELRAGQRIIRNQAVAYKMAAKLIRDAKERLLVAVRTLPVVTGKDKHPGDDVFEEALNEKLRLIRSNARQQPRTTFMFSLTHTRKDLLEDPGGGSRLADVERRLKELARIEKSSHGRFKLVGVEELANPLVVADDSYGIWVLFRAQAPIETGEPGLGLYSVGQAESQRVWDYMQAHSGVRHRSTAALMSLLTKTGVSS